MRPVLLAIGLLAATVFASTAALVPLLLVGVVVAGLLTRSRWVVLPSALIILLSTLCAGATTIGNIAWPERTIAVMVAISLLLLLLLLAVQATVIVLALSRRPAAEPR